MQGENRHNLIDASIFKPFGRIDEVAMLATVLYRSRCSESRSLSMQKYS
jgi:hypothetical protein